MIIMLIIPVFIQESEANTNEYGELDLSHEAG